MNLPDQPQNHCISEAVVCIVCFSLFSIYGYVFYRLDCKISSTVVWFRCTINSTITTTFGATVIYHTLLVWRYRTPTNPIANTVIMVSFYT